MPALTGHFEGDFSKFADAVDGATIKLRSFETDSNKVSASLNRMTDSFSGRQVIQQATLMVEAVESLGGVANLTEKELARLAPTVNEAVEKMQKLGMTVPSNMAAIAKETQNVGTSLFSMGSIVKAVSGPLAALFSVQAIIQFAGQVLDAGDAIQKMADQTSMTTDEVQQLQYIAGQTGSSMDTLVSAAQGVTEKLGSGDSGVTGALAKMNINLQEFKKLGSYEQMQQLSEGLRGVKDPSEQAALAADLFKNKWKEVLPALRSDMRALGDEAPKMSAEAVAGLDAIGDGMARLKQTAISWAGETVNAMVKAGGAVKDFYERFDTRHLGMTEEEAADPLGMKKALASIPALQLPVIEGLQAIKLTTEEIAAIEADSTKTITENAAAKIAANAAEKKSLEDLKAASDAYWGSVQKLVEEALGTEQLRLASQWDDAMDLLVEDAGSLGVAVSKLSEKMRAELVAAMQDAIAVMAANGTLTSDLSSRYAELLLAVNDYNASLRQQADVAMPAATGAVTDYTRALYEQARAEDAIRNARAMAAFAQAPGGPNVGGSVDGIPYTSPTGNQGGDVFQPYEGGGPSGAGWALPSSGIQPRAAGGPVTAGQTYRVGERGPELFTPGANGMITPGGGGVVVSNVFHIVDTEANLARRVSDAIARSITQARKV